VGKGRDKMIILFDLDGTLIDSTEAILESFHHAFEAHNFAQPSDDEIKALIGYPLDIMFEGLGIERAVVWEFVATYKENYRKISTQKTFLIENAREAVLEASEFATLGIVTTKTAEYSKILMEFFGLMSYFEVLIGREDVQNPKPHAEPILKAMEALDIEGKEVWMIGDTKLDLIAAKSAGVNSIGVLSGYDPREVIEQFTDIVFSDAFEAVIHLKSRKKSHN
jgi:phosphoglycolate phosphatase